MKKFDQNTTPVIETETCQETGSIPETVINTIAADERIEEYSVIDIDSIENDEKSGSSNFRRIKPLTIVDELENGIIKDNKIQNVPSINIGRLASRINTLNSVRKKKKPATDETHPDEKKNAVSDEEKHMVFDEDETIASSVPDNNGIETTETEEIGTDIVSGYTEYTFPEKTDMEAEETRDTDLEDKFDFSESTTDIEEELDEYINKTVDSDLLEFEEIFLEEEKPEQKDIIDELSPSETETPDLELAENTEDTEKEIIADTAAEIEEKPERENIVKAQQEITFEKPRNDYSIPEQPSEPAKDHYVSIEIPDNLLGKIPKNFNIDELGKIDLNEAEIIASEDFLSLTKGEIIEGLEDLDIFREENTDAGTPESAADEPDNIPVKEELISREYGSDETDKDETDKQEPAEKALKKSPADDINSVETAVIEKTGQQSGIETDESHQVTKEPENVIVENSAESAAAASKEEEKEKEKESKKNSSESTVKEFQKSDTNIEENDNSLDDPLLIEEIEVEEEPLQNKRKINKINSDYEYIPPGDRKEKVLFIDSEDNSSSNPDNNAFEKDELEYLSTGIIDTADGISKQLLESDISDRKEVTGLIRDNYPTFVDLLKENEDNPKYFSDDIDFVDSSFMNRNNVSAIPDEMENLESIELEKSTSYETATGLIPEEIKIIENQLFDIDIFNTGHEEPVEKITGFDQLPDDTITLSNYKYILPFPESLNEEEKKSIEGELYNKNALILEEDVEKIKKKLEDSMKKQIEETIQDITDKITIYEENKKNNNDTLTAKEDIKKLLKYLNDLFDQLPEKSVKDFADSEYYNLYKKVLDDMEK
ncbi:MAG: hypothetical protein JW864_06005 [Spirochaetes bacterium]|nr:hypothetical protein [Spirochaetota bacterium]